MRTLELMVWSALLMWLCVAWRTIYLTAWQASETKHRKRRLKARSPEDCPACQSGQGLRGVNSRPTRAVHPWSEVKGKGGRKKQSNTEGHACPNPACRYHGMRDHKVHALILQEQRGKTGDIWRLRCQACGQRFSERPDTVLARLKTPPERIELVLTLLAEGVDISVVVRVFGHCEETIVRWLERAGDHAALLHDLYVRDLAIDHLQLDELYAKVRQAPDKHWLWAAIAPCTKIVPSVWVGKRTTADAHHFVHDVVGRLAANCVPLFTTDGLRQYFWALTAHFGFWRLLPRHRKPTWFVHPDLLYGQLKKFRVDRKLKYVVKVGWCGTRQVIRERLQGLGYAGTINTAYIERFNLTLRQMVAPLTRKTWSLAQSPEHLMRHVEWARAYYHFSRVHSSLSLDRTSPKHSGNARPPWPPV
jgi:IS1 family transposase/transposase-like protein